MRRSMFMGLLILLVSCNNCDEESQKTIATLQHQYDSLLSWKMQQDSVMNTINLTNGDIDSTLSVINRKKSSIEALAKKGRLSKSDRKFILEQMDSINLLLELNRSRVAQLDSTLSQENMAQGCYQQMVQNMSVKNESENQKLTGMKKELAQVSKDFSDLFEEFVYKEAENMEMREQLSSAEQKLLSAKEKLNSAWYVVGTKDALKEKGIVYKSGFFDSKAVNEDFDKQLFRKVDIHELKEIILDAKKAEIMTTHPSGSYELVGMKKKVNKLIIRDPESFWSVSKFLIIETE